MSCAAPALPAAPEAAPPGERAEAATPAAGAADVVPRRSVTRHRIDLGKEALAYTAIAGDVILRDKDGGPKASIFSISYLKDGAEAAARPITFLFNGGPGSTAVWLHLGAFGPKRIDLPDDPTNPGAPPYRLADNPHTLLRVSDLVFVDPVGTGYSRSLGKSKDEEFWGVDEDSASLAEFIRAYLTANKRWNSPKYLAGESYGTIRASLLIRDLELNLLDSVFFNGVILISAALDARTFINPGPVNELPYVTDLPTFAATAHFHRALADPPRDLDAFLREAREFAAGEYLTALFQGDALPEERKRALAERLRGFTGLDTGYILRSNLRIDRDRFRKELLRSRGLTIAAHDTRFLGKDPDDVGESVQRDPFLFGISGPFTSVINDYLAGPLAVTGRDEPYKVFSFQANVAWKRPGGENRVFSGFLNTTAYLAEASATNKDFRVFVASGLHDLTTTSYGTEYVFRHSGVDPGRLTLKSYPGGHMMYLDDGSLKQLSEDIGAFLSSRR
jgi:carboxypeptidase C (cathepsin A)